MNKSLVLGGLAAAAGLALLLGGKKEASAAAHIPPGASGTTKPKPKPQSSSKKQNPGMPPADVLGRMAAALQTQDPSKIRAEAAKLRKEGWLSQADELDKAADIVAQMANVPATTFTPAPAPTVPILRPPTTTVSVPAPAPTIPVTQAQTTSNNHAMAVSLARHLVGKKKGSESKSMVADYQSAEGLGKVDGKYGYNTAISLAKYDLVPPKPLYWGQGNSYKSMVEEQARWKAWCLAKAKADPSRAAEWTAASRVS